MSCCDQDCHAPNADARYRRILWAALGVNVAMFLAEIVTSFLAGSVSLRADALDFWAMPRITPSRLPSSVFPCSGARVPRC